MRKFMRSNFSAFILVFVLVILSGAFGTAWATTTSTINVGDTEYTLFTGFNATDGTAVDNAFVYGNMVDGNTSTSFHAFTSPAYVEFNTEDPIVPKGYIFNTYNADSFKPTGWELKAKANDSDSWTTLSSYSGQSLASGQEFQYACNNDSNTKYKYFRFEASNSGNNIWLTEIRLYGFENLTYTHLTVRAATCTETGIKQDCYLRSDGKYFSDENGTNELAESDVIAPMIAHTLVHHVADENHIEYWQCSVCNKYFSDENCTTEISENQTLVLKYLDSNGTLTTLSENTTTITSSLNAWSNGWYVVYENITISDRITVSGTVNLILCNGATLTASKGITVGSDATFNVYAQSTDEAIMGALVASAEGNSNNAAIGGMNNVQFGSIVINGGKITATTNMTCGAPIGGGYGSNSGSITINGGIVSATAGDYSNSAGIGGGNNGYVASVTLNGGIITATGDAQYGGAGIGTGSYGGNGTMTITIGGGVKKLVATKGKNSDCIGKQPNANTTIDVVFKNGETTVEGNNKDAVFYDSGEGSQRQIRTKALNHTITIADGIKASVTPDTECALAGETVTLTLSAGVDASTLKVNNGTVSLTNTGDGKYTFTMPDGNVTVTATVSETYSVNLPVNMEIVSATNAADANGKYISGTVITFKASFPYMASNVSDGTNTLTATDGLYSVTVGTADITITATVQRNSTIDLSGATANFTAIDNDVLTGTTDRTVTIAEGASITLSGATINGGIVCNSNGDVTIILVGTNSVTGAYGKAGIQVGGSGTTLTIRGDGSLTATGGTGGAGIGTSVVHVNETFTGGNITIESGTVTAIGTEFDENTHDGGNGIGTGYIYANASGQIGTVTIYDGIDKVDASSITNFDSVVYMHGETDVTTNKTDYFTIGEDGNRRLIVQKPVIADIANQTYTGSAITPEPQVIIGSLSLTKGTDYTYSYTDNTNVGTNAKVTVTFKGDYASLGSVEKTFTIIPAVFVSGGIEHGNVTADKAGAVEGDTVTMTITPGEGYNIGTVSYNDGSEHTLEAVNGVYSFTMPAVSVTISVTFTPIEYTITYDLADGELAEGVSNPTTYTVETATFTLTNPTKNGSTFAGWTGSNGDTAQTEVKIAKGSTGDRSYKANWEKKSGSTQEDDPSKPTFRAHALKLDGEIAAIFYMNLPQLNGVNYADSYMEFTLSRDRENLDELRAYYADTITTSRTVGQETKIYYGFKCPVASSQMADTITATLHYGDNLTVSQDYSVVQYLDEVLVGNYTGTDKDLMLAIQDYGHYAQLMLSQANNWEIGVDHTTIDAKNPDIASDVETVKGLTSGKASQKSNSSTVIKDIGFALLLETVTTINVYFDIVEGYKVGTEGLKVTVDGTEKSAIPLHDGTQYMIQIPNIPAQDLNKAHAITGNNGGEFSITNLSALSYVNKVLNSAEESIGGVDIATMKNAVTAFYKYHKATLDYMAQ